MVLLPIPFSDLSSHKVRPAIVIGLGAFPGDLFVVPLTSRLDHADFPLAEWQAAGLNVPSAVKAQLATVESRLVRKIVGRISARDEAALDIHLRRWLSLRTALSCPWTTALWSAEPPAERAGSEGMRSFEV